jgi:hypothetical protein
MITAPLPAMDYPTSIRCHRNMITALLPSNGHIHHNIKK